MFKPLVSLLVPIFGVEKYVDKCIVSLFKQTYKNIEYIFVNDCTPDKSMEVLHNVIKKFPERESAVRIINHNRNKGLAAARNTAIKNATGKYVIPVDSDDYLEIDAVDKAVSKASIVDADVVVFGMNHVFRNKVVAVHGFVPNDKIEYIKKIIERDCAVCICGGMYKRSLYLQNNIWAIEGLNFGEDYLVKPRLIYFAREIVCIKEALYNYVHYNSGSYTKSFSMKNVLDQEMVIESLTDFFSKVPNSEIFRESLAIAALKVKAELLIGWGLLNGNRESWVKIVKLCPWVEIKNVGRLKYKIVLWAAQMNLPTFVRLYSKLGIWMKQLLK